MAEDKDVIFSYVERGWYVFPVREKSKHPIPNLSWPKLSTNDAEQILEYKRRFPGCNFALDCGRSGVAVLDIDTKHPEALDNLMALEMDNGVLPPTLKVRTPSGGFHLYYEGKISNSASTLGLGVDTRGVGGYVLIPGSYVDEKGVKGGYEIVEDHPVAAVPSWLPLKLEAPKEKTEAQPVQTGDADTVLGVSTFTKLMLAHDQIEEGTRNHATYTMAARGRDLGLSQEMVLQLMRDVWIEKLAGDFSLAELTRTVNSVYKTARNAPGCETPEAMFPEDDVAGDYVAGQQTTVLPAASILEDEDDMLMSWSAGTFDPADIPPRDWILMDRAMGGFVDVIVAPGGSSKSTFLITECAAIVTGKPLTGTEVRRPGPCWLINGEDPDDELQRRVTATVRAHGLDRRELDDLYLTSGYGEDWALVADTRQGVKVNKKLIERIIKHATSRRVARLVFDPLIRFHRCDENDNGAMDVLMRVFAEMAARIQCAISVAHHSNKKGGGDDANGNMNNARGASSVLSAARIGHTMNVMGQKDAKRLGITEDQRKWFVRIDSAKGNMSSPTGEAHWLRRISVDIDNEDAVGALVPVDLSFVEELEGDDLALAQAVHDILVSCGKPELSTYQLAKELTKNPGMYPEIDGSNERTLRRSISNIFTQEREVCGSKIILVEKKGQRGKITEVITITEAP